MNNHGIAVNESYLVTAEATALSDVMFYWMFSNKRLGYTTNTCAQHIARKSYCGHDLGIPNGTPLYLCAVGATGYAICTYSGSDYKAGWGEYMVFSIPGTGLQVWYAHLKPGSQRFKKGDIVLASDIVAQTDDSGNSTGPHLHIGFLLNGAWVNPWGYIKNAQPYSGGTPVEQPKPIDGIELWILGVFVSKYQKAIDWRDVAIAGNEIAYIRLGHGPSLDPYFWANVEGADNAGLKTMPVYLPFWNMPAGDQVDWIVDQIGGVEFDFPIVIDAEEDTYGKSPVQVDQRLMTFARELRGVGYNGSLPEITLYSNYDWWSRNIPIDRSAKWNAAQWIVANYVDNPYSVGPIMPPGITRVDGWQYNQTGSVDGIPTQVCQTLFNPATFETIDPPPPPPPTNITIPPSEISYDPYTKKFIVQVGDHKFTGTAEVEEHTVTDGN